MHVLFGETRSPTDLGKPVSGKLDLVEILVRPGRTPKAQRLAEMRKRQRSQLVLSVVAGEEVVGPAAEAAVDVVARSCSALSARYLIVRVPTALRPGRSSERAIEKAIASLSSACDTELLLEATGLWQPHTTRALCRALGVGRVQTLEELASTLEPEPKPYLRVVQLGAGRARFNKHVDAAAAALSQCQEACVVVDGGSAAVVRQALEGALVSFLEDAVE